MSKVLQLCVQSISEQMKSERKELCKYSYAQNFIHLLMSLSAQVINAGVVPRFVQS